MKDNQRDESFLVQIFSYLTLRFITVLVDPVSDCDHLVGDDGAFLSFLRFVVCVLSVLVCFLCLLV